MSDELESDIQHLEEVLKDFKGCDECKKDHERLLSYLKELQTFRNARDLMLVLQSSSIVNTGYKKDPFIYEWDNNGAIPL